MLFFTRGAIVLLVWSAWLVYWRLSAANVKPAIRHESKWSGASCIIPIVIASILFSIPPIAGGGFLFSRFLPPGIDAYWPGVILIATGLGFSTWLANILVATGVEQLR